MGAPKWEPPTVRGWCLPISLYKKKRKAPASPPPDFHLWAGKTPKSAVDDIFFLLHLSQNTDSRMAIVYISHVGFHGKRIEFKKLS